MDDSLARRRGPAGRVTYSSWMGRPGEYGGTFKAHVAGVLMNKEVRIRSALVGDSWLRVGAIGSEKMFLHHSEAKAHYDVLLPDTR